MEIIPLEVQHHPQIDYECFRVVYDGKHKIPLYTYELLTPENLLKQANRELSHFQIEARIYPTHRSSLKDYCRSGYDRGHMVPAADQAFSQKAMDETFYLSNICPQNTHLNRTYWSRLEKSIRSVVLKGFTVEVLTGPLFLPVEEEGRRYIKYEVIGENNVAVPTHFFKLIKIHSNEKQYKIYVIPNSEIPSQTPIEDFEVSLEELERCSGLKF